VAREAQVSTTTVSLVLRVPHPPNITAVTQQRVRNVVRQIGYVRNQAGRELRSGTNTTLGFITSGIA
jgi:LacI family transcriptional regulator